jgi:hypothetical protein
MDSGPPVSTAAEADGGPWLSRYQSLARHRSLITDYRLLIVADVLTAPQRRLLAILRCLTLLGDRLMAISGQSELPVLAIEREFSNPLY